MWKRQTPSAASGGMMPDASELREALSADDLRGIERQLRTRRAELLEGIARLEAELAADVAGECLPLHVLQGELEQTQRALERLGHGTYGACEGCGTPIARRRLQVLPSATLCSACSGMLRAVRPTH